MSNIADKWKDEIDKALRMKMGFWSGSRLIAQATK